MGVSKATIILPHKARQEKPSNTTYLIKYTIMRYLLLILNISIVFHDTAAVLQCYKCDSDTSTCDAENPGELVNCPEESQGCRIMTGLGRAMQILQ